MASGSIWFGAYLARLLTTYQLFKETELILKDFLNSSNLPAVNEVLSPLIYLTTVSYLIMIVSFTIFLLMTNLRLKENGWLFIIAAIIYITLPFESVLITVDYKLMNLFMTGDFGSKAIKLVTERLTRLSSVPIILILSYISIPFLLVFKPFTLKSKDED